MKIYIVQADYDDVVPEDHYNSEDDCYESEVYQCKDIEGVYPTLEDAKRGVKRAMENDPWNCPTERDFDIIEVDTEKIRDNGFEMKVL